MTCDPLVATRLHKRDKRLEFAMHFDVGQCTHARTC